jgi:oxalate decarboxylase/phosphoglucose isomerase-like protein (cupin superfamily)
VVFIPGDAEHEAGNTGTEDLVWLYVFAADGFGKIVYRFSDEVGETKLRGKEAKAKL